MTSQFFDSQISNHFSFHMLMTGVRILTTSLDTFFHVFSMECLIEDISGHESIIDGNIFMTVLNSCGKYIWVTYGMYV